MIPTLELRAIACNYSKFCKDQEQAWQRGWIFPRLEQKMAANGTEVCRLTNKDESPQRCRKTQIVREAESTKLNAKTCS